MLVTIWHLEMTDPAQLVPPSRPVSGLEVREESPGDPALVRRFYLAVGEAYRWVDRRPWTQAQWTKWAAARDIATLVAHVDGREAGFAVLSAGPDGGVELDYFGLLGDFIGRGYGSAFLFETVRRAFARGARRVFLNTCSLDHPTALPGYKARGFRVYRTALEDRNEDGTKRESDVKGR